MNRTPTVCLNMIVKDESHIIEETLKKLVNKIKFDYWVISDTGSTDNTKEIITNFFKNMNINGEMYDDEWVDFSHNRSKALEYAYNKTDYILIFDADDEICGDFKLPENFIDDGYYLKFGDEHGYHYKRMLLVNNRKKWIYKSVVHEFICNCDPIDDTPLIEGNYYVVSGRMGFRNQQPDKYLKDALILEKAHEIALKENDDLHLRYAFYCANSYKDSGKNEEAIKWYKITLNQNNWYQEKYISCLNLYDCYCKIGCKETGFYYLVQSIKYDSERAECLVPLIQHYCNDNLSNISYNYYLNIKNFFENYYLHMSCLLNDKLFIKNIDFDLLLPYYMIIVCERLKEYKTGIKMYEIIFTKKFKTHHEHFIGNMLFNLQFFIDEVVENDNFIELFQEYIDFLIQINYPLFKHEFLKKYEKYGINLENVFKNIEQKFTKEECKNSKKILFFVGYASNNWNYTYSLTNALGGSERAVIYLSEYFPKDYEIYISGNIQKETIGNITYLGLDELPELIERNAFHTVIVSRYISFFENYSKFSAYQTYIWGHDIHLHSYGCNISQDDILKKWYNRITGCICQTEWHKNTFINTYPLLKDKIHTINNGISLEKFKFKLKKISNRFIYTSCSERGLDRILELWPEIIKNIPKAELFIASYNNFPCNEFEEKLSVIIKNYDNIYHVGKLNSDKLYELMSTAEYWLYPTRWLETSCITAMEMLFSDVICIYYPLAGLVNTLGDYGIAVETGNEIETIINLTTKRKNDIINCGKEYALSCSWENRYNEWSKILFDNENENNNSKKNLIFFIDHQFKLISLFDYFDSLKEKYNVTFINDYDKLFDIKNSLILFTINFLEKDLIDDFLKKDINKDSKNKYGFFNTEPLNIPYFFEKCKKINQDYPDKIIYDYSKSNIRILNNKNIKNTLFLPYQKTIEENNYLTNLNNTTEKIYDFGLIGSDKSSDIELLGPRRERIVNILKEKGFLVNVISGWKNTRDEELAKCKVILNIHGQINYNENASLDETTLIFEHIRCNRLLDAGFNILSENVVYLDDSFKNKYKNLKFIDYNTIKNIDISIQKLTNEDMWKNIIQIKNNTSKYCFIQSCTIQRKGRYRLENIINILNKSGCVNIFDKIYINNIGLPIENKYGDKFEVINYSENIKLFEIPTINFIREFSENNPNCYILYLHTKGVSYSNDYIQENHWINYMLYFLVEKYENCISLLDMSYESLGCNYSNDFDKNIFRSVVPFPPPHYSGNFWWANTNHLKTLPKISTENINKNDAEFWLFKNNHKYFNLHNSNINHYVYRYPREIYENK